MATGTGITLICPNHGKTSIKKELRHSMCFRLVATDKVVDDHATNSAGLMWGLDNGFGVKGIAATSKAGYTIWEVENMLDLGNLLEAGDVIQVGVQYLVKDYFPDLCAEARYPGTGADLQYHKDTCYLPVEYWPATADAIKYLVQEKGIHFVMAGKFSLFVILFQLAMGI